MRTRSERPGPPKGSRRTIRIDVQYDGTRYVGWQRQPKGESVQGALEKALSKVASEKITLHGASRTDAGVHARQQVASFSLKAIKPPAEAFLLGTNSLLPEDIRVTASSEVDFHFLAGANVREKTYRYFLDVGPIPRPFFRNYAWHLRGPLDMDWMKEGMQYLIGTHDFSSFRASRSDTKTSVRTIREAEFLDAPFDLSYFQFTADGFLKHMVRTIIGTLVEIGFRKRKPDEMAEILQAKDRRKAGRAAPPHGLFLWSING